MNTHTTIGIGFVSVVLLTHSVYSQDFLYMAPCLEHGVLLSLLCAFLWHIRVSIDNLDNQYRGVVNLKSLF